MKVSAILTLIAGLVLGFFIGQATRLTAPSSPPSPRDRARAQPASPPDATVYRLRSRTPRREARPTRW